MNDWIKNKLIPFIGGIGENLYVQAIQKGLMAVVSITIISGIITLLKTPPVIANTENAFMLAWINFSKLNAGWLDLSYQLTLGMLGLWALMAITYALAGKYKMNAFNATLLTTIVFLILSVNLTQIDPQKAALGFNIQNTWLDSKGLFAAIILSILCVELIRFLEKKGIKIKLPDSVPPAVSQPFETLIINCIIFLFAVLVRLGFQSQDALFPQFIMELFKPLVSGSDTFFSVVLLMALMRLLWSFGIHGTSLVLGVVAPITLANTTANIAAYSQGLEPTTIFNAGLTVFQIGLLPAAIVMLLFSKSQQLKSIGKIGFIPSIFNIGEPLTFGTPFVLNPILTIPHILTFSANWGIAYLVMAAKLVGKPIFQVPFTIPGPVATFMTTLDWKAPILWGILVSHRYVNLYTVYESL